MIGFGTSIPIHLCCSPTDMRKNFDGLCGLITQHFKKDPLRDGAFVFVNRRCDKMKILFWDRHGFWILFKRLEAGVFQMPRAERDENSIDSIKITYEQLVMILEGIDLTTIKRRKRYNKSDNIHRHFGIL